MVENSMVKSLIKKKYLINIVLALLAIGIEVFYSICGGSCLYLHGDLFGIGLQYIGIAFMALLIFLSIIKKDFLLTLALSAGVGVEIYLVGFQVWYNTYCSYCLTFGAVLIALFFLNIRKKETKIALVCGAISLVLFALFFRGSATPSYASETLVPSFGYCRSTFDSIRTTSARPAGLWSRKLNRF